MYRYLLRPLLFQIPPEKAHRLTFAMLRLPGISQLLGRWHRFDDPSLKREVFGLQFRNPVGMAAGFDKDAEGYRQLYRLGFGFVEIGTITPRAQPGNPQPRLFRLPKDQAIINRMGFNNGGIAEAIRRLRVRSADLIVGGNIGKNKDTPNDRAVNDYVACFSALFPYVDYFTVNVSSPNTPGLRQLQDREPLTALLKHLQEINAESGRPKPVLLKIAPDLSEAQLADIIRIVEDSKIDGIIATNTTIDRAALTTAEFVLEMIGNGGLSGKPLRQRSTDVIRFLHRESGGKIPIVGVGGIHSPEDALEKLEAGASLIQLYTGFIYEGPQLIKGIKRAIVAGM